MNHEEFFKTKLGVHLRGYGVYKLECDILLEDLYQAFKSRLMADIKADRQGDLYERPEGSDD